jgi:hypothetical protein
MLPVAVIDPAVIRLPPVTLPATLNTAGEKLPMISALATIILFPVMLPDADIPVVPSSVSAIKLVPDCIYGE